MKRYGQEDFVDNVRAALGHSRGDTGYRAQLFVGKGPERGKQDLEKIRGRTREELLGLLDKLIEEGKPLNVSVIRVKDVASVTSAIVQLVREKDPEWEGQKSVVVWKHPLLNSLKLPDALSDQNVPVFITELGDVASEVQALNARRKEIRKEVIDSYIGVTTADFCVAEAATLVMKTRPDQARSVSLVPSIHIAVIELDQLISDVDELYTILKYDEKQREEGLTNCLTLISGPSKTGDIELVMVDGAHGPRELYIYVITG